MLVRIRNSLNSDESIIEISKTATVEKLKKAIEEKLKVKPECQKLYFRGKHLEEENTLYDYKIDMNDVIQLMIKSTITLENEKKTPGKKTEDNVQEDKENEDLVDCTSDFYKIGDPIDCIDEKYGAWFEASIVRICRKNQEKKLIFVIKWEFIEHAEPFHATEQVIRPRAWKIISAKDLKVGEKVMINHNLGDPTQIGHWYDFKIDSIGEKRNKVILTGTLYSGINEEPLPKYTVTIRDKIYAVEKPKLLVDRSEVNISRNKRPVAPECFKCNDKPNVKCSECGCKSCGGKNNPNEIILCDECEDEYHIGCLKPPLLKVPEDDWYCPNCKRDDNEIIKMGQKVSKRQGKNNVDHNKKTRDWGRGMACIGRNKECTIVKKNHRGPIPGIEVGSMWYSRILVSESGVHRPPVSGIHGIATDCAYSIVMSTGYGDTDHGDEFIYTGSGGRDLSGNKRTAKQSCDQELTRANKALALNCNAKFNDKEGAESKDWKAGIPVRVVRNYKLAKHSKYAPKEGNRYDGIYKVVKYYPERNEDGHLLWRYLLRRNDPIPAPWTEKGKERIARLGLEMQYPEGFDHLMDKSNDKKNSKGGEGDEKQPKKKQKVEPYTPDNNVSELIDSDESNSKLWEQCKSYLQSGKINFLNQVSKSFQCVCCHDLVFKPVTTPCAHNICKSCIKRSFKAGVHSCPTCRFALEENFEFNVNKQLSEILISLFPGYEGGRE